jgi:hypothetical protein
MTRRRRLMPASLASLTGPACVLCCSIPLLIGAGLVGGTAWTAFGKVLPGLAVLLAALTGAAWWWSSRRRHDGGCVGGAGCGCAQNLAS